MRHIHLPGPRFGVLVAALVLTLFGGAGGALAHDGRGGPGGFDGFGGPGMFGGFDGLSGPDVSGPVVFGFADDPMVLATATVRNGAPIDGIPAGPMVDGGFHIHAHLTLFINGREAWVPAGIGVLRPIILDPEQPHPSITAGTGFYWLHTHDESGVIHAEAPEAHQFTLGQFFDIWGQPLTRHGVGPASGDVTVWVDGKPFTGDPRDVVITPHEAIQLNVGWDVPFVPYVFPSNF